MEQGPGPAHPQLLSELQTPDRGTRPTRDILLGWEEGVWGQGGLWHAHNHLELMQNLSAGADVSQGSGISLKEKTSLVVFPLGSIKVTFL